MTAEERELQSRSLRREINERIAEVIEGFHDSQPGDPAMTVFCECGSEECMAPIETTLAEYQAVRASPTFWVISSAHIDTTVDSVIARRNGYALIDHASHPLSRQAHPRGRSRHRLRRQACPNADSPARGLRADVARIETNRCRGRWAGRGARRARVPRARLARPGPLEDADAVAPVRNQCQPNSCPA